jgi:hypothetical protein
MAHPKWTLPMTQSTAHCSLVKVVAPDWEPMVSGPNLAQPPPIYSAKHSTPMHIHVLFAPAPLHGSKGLHVFQAVTLHSTMFISRRVVRELERIWQEAIVDHSRRYPSICLEHPRRTTKISRIASVPGETLVRSKRIAVYQLFQWRNGNCMYHLLQD